MLSQRLKKMVGKAKAAGLDERDSARCDALERGLAAKDFKVVQRQLSKLVSRHPNMFPVWTIDAARRVVG